MRRTEIYKWATQPPKSIEPAEESPYFWVSAVDKKGILQGILDFVEISKNWECCGLMCRSLQDLESMPLDAYISKMKETYEAKLLWLQAVIPPMPDDTGVFKGPANDWNPCLDLF